MMPSLKRALSALRPARKPPIPTVQWLLEHRSSRVGQPALIGGRTPLASLYRMYEYLVLGYTAGLRTEIEFFFNQASWAVSDITDPKDEDPERYGILAVLPAYLCLAFNRLIERGLPRDSPAIIAGPEAEAELRSKPHVLEEVPRWTKTVSRLQQELVIPDQDGQRPSEAAQSKYFAALNIIVEEPHIYFV